MNFGIVGAGVVGLTTALELQAEYSNAKITILSDKFLKDTTSDVAAGIFRPGTSFSGPTQEITERWIRDAYEHWDKINRSSDASLAGVTELSGYIFSGRSPAIVKNHFMEKLCPVYRAATEDELTLCPGDWKYGSFFTTLLTETGLYMPWAIEKFKSQGGQILQQRITDLTHLQGRYDIVFNCTGLGAKELLNDHKLVPIRGQVFKVAAPWVKMAFFGDYDTYIIPGFNAVTLGGCRNFDSYDDSVSRHDSAAIQERCEAMLPSLKTAKVLAERVGLRPHRDPVRVELEFKETTKGVLKLIHNYGHGGYGVLSSPGTAKHAVRLVKDARSGQSKL